MIKRCARCQRQLPLDEFGRDKRMALGRKSWCRACGREDARKRYAAGGDAFRVAANERSKANYNPERRRAWVLKKNYGLTVAEFDEMLSAQGGRCAICRADQPGGRGNWHVDHCHDTGRNRGLLCSFCNPGLGYFRDDPERLQAAISYLENAS